VDVGKDTTSGDSDSTEQLVQLFIVLDGKSDVTRYDTALLVITSGISSELENLGTEVLENGSKVDRGASSHTSGVLALTKVSADTTNGELQTSLGGGGGGLFLSSASFSFSFSRHDEVCLFDLLKRKSYLFVFMEHLIMFFSSLSLSRRFDSSGLRCAMRSCRYSFYLYTIYVRQVVPANIFKDLPPEVAGD
jgi:hypothetical protein